MGKRADEPVTSWSSANYRPVVATQIATSVPDEEGGEEAAMLRLDIERTRQDMSRTVFAIEERLSPAHLKEQMADVKDTFIAQYEDVKEHIKQDIKNEVREAKDKVKEEIHEAKHMVQEQIEHAKTAVHDATVGRVKHMVVDARETVTDAGSSVFETIKANPIPASLIAVGLGWLVVSSMRGTRSESRRLGARRSYDNYAEPGYDYEGGSVEGGEPGRGRQMLRQSKRAVGDAIHTVSEKASNLGHRVQEKTSGLIDQMEGAAHDAGSRIGDLGHRAQEGASHLAHDARDHATHMAELARDKGQRVARMAEDKYHRAGETLENTYDTNPLAFGALSLAVGAAIGLALPHTQKEDAWMGDAKERLLRSAQGLAQDALHKVQDQASELTSGMGDERKLRESRQQF